MPTGPKVVQLWVFRLMKHNVENGTHCQYPFVHPLTMAYGSGDTGLPKDLLVPGSGPKAEIFSLYILCPCLVLNIAFYHHYHST